MRAMFKPDTFIKGFKPNSKKSYLNENWKILNINPHGYGKSFIIDFNEIYYIAQNSFFTQGFINDLTTSVSRINFSLSVLDSNNLVMKKLNELFMFVSSLGLDGFLGSTWLNEKVPE